MVEQLEDDQLDEFISNHNIVILDIFTTWCGPCVMQAMILEELAKEVDQNRVTIIKMDADQCPKLSQRFNVRAIPTVILFHGGEVAKAHIGVWPKEDLLKEISAFQ